MDKNIELITLLKNYGFDENNSKRIAIMLGNVIDDLSIIKKSEVKKAQKYRVANIEIFIESEKLFGTIRLNQSGLSGKVVSLDKKFQLDLAGTSAYILKLDPEEMYGSKMVFVGIYKDKNNGKIKRIRAYDENAFNSLGLSEEELLVNANRHTPDSISNKPLFENVSSVDKDLALENKGKGKTIGFDEYFHMLVGEILNYPVNQNVKKL